MASSSSEKNFRVIFFARSAVDDDCHAVKVKVLATHPTYNWVCSADEAGNVVLWDYGSHDVLHSFNPTELHPSAPHETDRFLLRVEDQAMQDRLSLQCRDIVYSPFDAFIYAD